MDLAMSPHEAIRQIRSAIESFDETMDASWLTRQLQQVKTIFSASTLRTKGKWNNDLWPALMHQATTQLQEQLQREANDDLENNLKYIRQMRAKNQQLYASEDRSSMLTEWPAH